MNDRTVGNSNSDSRFPDLNGIAGVIGGFVVTPVGTDAGDGTGTGGSERIRSIAIDSRVCTAGSLFFALEGENTDGELFVDAARSHGASAAVVRHESSPDGRPWTIPVVVVPDSLVALQKLAIWYVDTWLSTTMRIGITGSNGKTTTKEFVRALLSLSGEVYASKGNLNSETGLPLSVFDSPPGVPFAVYEMAMSAPGEMKNLADIVRPRYALITNVGIAHAGLVGSRDAIASEKKMISSRFTGKETLLLPENDDYRDFLAEGIRGTVVYFGPKSQNATIRDGGDRGLVITFGDRAETVLPMIGRHNGMNALGAIRLVETVTGSIPDLDEVAWTETLPSGRAERIRLAEGGIVIHDAYNANPDSMRAALKMVDDLQKSGVESPTGGRVSTGETKRPLVVVLGDMYELGSLAATAHDEVLAEALQLEPDSLFLVGDEFRAAFRRRSTVPDTVVAVSDVTELSERLRSFSGRELVLLKGSRAVGLEALIPGMTKISEIRPPGPPERQESTLAGGTR